MPSRLARWDPFGELTELRSRFDRAFEDLTDGRERDWTMAIDVERDNGNLVIHAEVPGIKPEEVKIEVQDDILTVSGKHEEDSEEEHKHYVRRERRYGSFSRSIALPAGVDSNRSTPRPRTVWSRSRSHSPSRHRRRRSRSPRRPADDTPNAGHDGLSASAAAPRPRSSGCVSGRQRTRRPVAGRPKRLGLTGDVAAVVQNIVITCGCPHP